MATATPSPPPSASHEEEDNNNNQQPPSPLESVPSPTSPIEDVDQLQQFANSNSVYSPLTSVGEPEKSVVCEHPPPEDVEDEPEQEPIPASEDVEDEREQKQVPASPPPHDKIDDLQQSSAPPSPSSILQRSPSPTPPPPPTEPEHPPESLTPGHESPISKQSPSPPTQTVDPVESPNFRETPNPNPNSDHESPSPYSPTTVEANPSPKPHESPNNPSPSPPPPPPPTAASPSSPPVESQPPLPVTTWSPNKPLVLPWTHQETTNLIQAYQEKWYSLKKGPLKASQWEEVAITVAARCGYDDPTKTAKQCRHKIEKLRKRYRTERTKPRSKSAAWNFFKLMDNLEKGPLPISSSQPMALVEYQKPSNSNPKKRKINNNHNNNDDGDDSEFLINKRTRSKTSNPSNHHISNGGLSRDLRFPAGTHNRVMRGLRTPIVNKHKGFYQEVEEDDDEINEEDEGNEDEGVGAQLAAEIKGFAEKFVKLENKKIEMIRDVERYRLEMENKRMEMILESQQMLVETVNKAFSRSLKPHKLSAN